MFQDETDSIAETEAGERERAEVKRELGGEVGGAINLTSRPSSAPTTSIADTDTEVGISGKML